MWKNGSFNLIEQVFVLIASVLLLASQIAAREIPTKSQSGDAQKVETDTNVVEANDGETLEKSETYYGD